MKIGKWKLKIYKIYGAFSLIELMIVMAIIGIMSVAAMAYLSNSRSSVKIKVAQGEVASVIKLAQAYALQGKKQGGVTPCGYGFRFSNLPGNETDYEIFYNTYNVGSYGYSNCSQLNNDSRGRQYISGAPGSTPAEQYSLKDSVRRQGGSPSSYELYFTVPHATAYDTNGVEITSGQIDITLRIPGVTSKSVTFFPGGRIVESQ